MGKKLKKMSKVDLSKNLEEISSVTTGPKALYSLVLLDIY